MTVHFPCTTQAILGIFFTFQFFPLINNACAISIAAIETVDATAIDTAFISCLTRIEQVMADSGHDHESEPLRSDSAKSKLLQYYYQWQDAHSHATALKADLVKSLLLLRLGERGVQWSYDSAKALLVKTAREHPDNRIVAWMQGVLDLQSGEITKGVRLFDSLLISGFNSAAFLRDYASGVSRALIPAKGATPLVALGKDTLPDTLTPVSYEWKVMRSLNGSNQKKLPCFSYGATFELRKPFHLVFAGLRQRSEPEAGLISIPGSKDTPDFLDQFFRRTETACCKIFIDLNKPQQTLSDQLGRRINGCYDSISSGHDLPASHGISLRCFTMPRYSAEDEKYTAIVTFDRPLADTRGRCGTRKPRKEIASVRYTLVVQSTSDVKNELDVKLRSLLRLFGSL
jgi:hypothetical protein